MEGCFKSCPPFFGFSLQVSPQRIICVHLSLFSASFCPTNQLHNLFHHFQTSSLWSLTFFFRLAAPSPSLMSLNHLKLASFIQSVFKTSNPQLFLCWARSFVLVTSKEIIKSSPYRRVDLVTFPFTLADTLLSQITPCALQHPFHLAITLLFTSFHAPHCSEKLSSSKLVHFLHLHSLHPRHSTCLLFINMFYV